ncbi:SWIM zinc finger family protein [Dactylosporangium roseum]|uniref:SWIM zinc finger family protein n=1 Tax=Dactylosporangium roseum TaxID=47989 RepID=A0ABY5Z3X0_9ACTN|nr:SWIM zinc finger family protein [Dactylosporangium roseum]UWZ36740.1 SWIM zinc finger family protein [Dactylosporangium roseum]
MAETTTVTTVWTTDQVMALAPDSSAQRAARGLAGDRAWLETGLSANDDLPPTVWGLCQGSGTTPYQTAVDLTEPAFKCTCPSRKFPCKHALALLLRWASGSVADAVAPAWAQEWQASRAARSALATRVAERADDVPRESGTRAVPSEKAQARRADRISAGLEELDRWLTDQARAGLATVAKNGYAHWDTMTARLVDAQATGAAGILRRTSAVTGSPERLLGELARLRLLIGGYRRLGDLPEDLAASIRMRVGLPIATETVLAGPAVRDRWQVHGVRDEIEDQLTVRRAWLRGVVSGRPLLVLSFAVAGQSLPIDLLPGTEIDADVCLYPGGQPARALIAKRHAPPERIHAVAGAAGIEANLRAHAEALAGDPWLDYWPMVLDAVTPVRDGAAWLLADADGNGLPLDAAAGEPWRLVAVTAGRPATVTAEWSAGGVRPMGVWSDHRLVRL